MDDLLKLAERVANAAIEQASCAVAEKQSFEAAMEHARLSGKLFEIAAALRSRHIVRGE